MEHKRKKILYIITKSAWGGAQKYVYDLATHLSPEQFDVTVAAGGNGELFTRLARAHIRAIPIPALERDVHIIKELAAFFYLAKIIAREKPDVVHLNSTKIGILGAIAAKCAFLATGRFSYIIFTAHGWGFKEDCFVLWHGTIFLAEFFGSLFQNKIIVIDSADYQSARKFIPARKLVLIPNGINAPQFLSRERARAMIVEKIGYPIDSSRLLIGTIAEFTKNKGLPYLLDALSRISRLSLDISSAPICVIIGSGENEKSMHQRIRALGLETSVFLPGFMPDAAMYMPAFDIFALPSVKEGLPYVVMEAMAAGLPIVASQVGGIQDLIEDGKNGILVPPKNPDALSRALHSLFQDAGTRASFGAYSRLKVKTKCTLRDMIEKTVCIYQNE
ncbi:MAG: glycosyl transferase family protein [Parcubacteria group bacterium Gr01-1014_33]|nr:MAG: glycosyl transferase family protein [Parcubacteria group bacterium Gr01-1014_33]